jgi:hypothetical protein
VRQLRAARAAAWYFRRVMSTHVEAFDLIAHAEVLEERLAAAARELAQRPGFTEEAAWLASARRKVADARKPIGDLTTRALRLPELEPFRAERGRALQGAIVEAFEALQVCISAEAGERSPLLVAIFRNITPPALRRGHRRGAWPAS